MRNNKPWLWLLLCLAIPVISACGNMSVGYSPVAVCGSMDYDPDECDR